jgi:hypothetical protein
MSVDHWMTFSTFAEQDHFSYPEKNAYQGVIINGNMAAYAPAGLAAFLLEKTSADTSYLIDPLTHAFQHDPGLIEGVDGRPKASIQKMADAYGAPVSDYVGFKPLLPENFESRKLLDAFVARCINYQKCQLSDYMKESDAAKYLLDPDTSLPPYAIIAPYFYLTETTIHEWLPVNFRAALSTVNQLEGTAKCFAAIVVSQGVLLAPDLIAHILSTFSGVRLDGFLLWADNLDEQSAAGAELNGLLTLARGLRGGGSREVINLHGGYFSILAAGPLGDGAMSGVAHGPEFGEFRSVVPVGGGIPISRYYVPKLHSRMRYREAAAIFREANWLSSAEEFHGNVCDCVECKSVLDGDPGNFTKFGEGNAKQVRRRHGIVSIDFPTKEAKARCLRHYLQRKHREYAAASKAPREALLKNLRDGEIEYRDLVGLSGVAHLQLWRKVFGDGTKAG